jgi:hypothetical protein
MSSPSSVSRAILTSTVAALPVTATIAIPNAAANHPDAKLFAMVGRVPELVQARDELEYAADDAYDEDAYHAAWQACADLQDQLALTPARTIAGVRCKTHALVALAYQGELDEGTDLNAGRDLVKSILRDLLSLTDALAS